MREDLFKKFYFSTMFSGSTVSLPDLDKLPGTYPKEYLDKECVVLSGSPKIELVKSNIIEILESRRSRREYASDPIGLDTISALLLYSAGITGYMRAYGYRNYPLRAFPSAGGLQATELYVGASKGGVDFLEAGVYHYNPVRHCLEKLGDEIALEKVKESLLSVQSWLRSAPPLIVILALDYARLNRKYGDHAARLAFADPGFLGENIYLVGEALGLSVTAMCGFDEYLMCEGLRLNLDDGEYPILAFTIGKQHR